MFSTNYGNLLSITTQSYTLKPDGYDIAPHVKLHTSHIAYYISRKTLNTFQYEQMEMLIYTTHTGNTKYRL